MPRSINKTFQGELTALINRYYNKPSTSEKDMLIINALLSFFAEAKRMSEEINVEEENK